MTPSPLILFEHQTKSLDKLGWSLDAPVLDYMEQINQQNGTRIFHLKRKQIRTTHFVGFVTAGEQALQILPKIYYEGNSDAPENSPEFIKAVETACFNLMVMLSAILDHPKKAKQIASLHALNKNWLEMMIHMFAEELHRECQGGLEHQYVSREETLPYIKGRWLVEHSLARFYANPTQFDLSYDEFSPDTLLNRIFATTINELITLTRDQTNYQLLHQLQGWFLECSLTPHRIQDDLNQVRFTRLNERFLFAFQLARLFWEMQTLVFSSGKIPGKSFLLDMNMLFERFLSWVLQKYAAQIFPKDWGITRILFQSKGTKYFLGEEVEINKKKPAFPIRPDALLFRGDLPYLVLDFKYKILSFSDQNNGIPESDIYQVLAYARALKLSRAVLIYPASTGFRHARKFVFGDVGIHAIPVRLNEPLDRLETLIQDLRHSLMAQE